MTPTDLDLPAIESAAREAQAESYGPWQQGASHDEDPSAVYSWPENGVPQSVADCFRRSYALHIATSSPDVVLAMVARIRELESDRRVHLGMINRLTSERGFYENEIDARRLLPASDVEHFKTRIRELEGAVLRAAKELEDIAITTHQTPTHQEDPEWKLAQELRSLLPSDAGKENA